MGKFIGAAWKSSRALNWLGGVILATMMLLTVLDVILRYAGRAITGTFELMSFGGALVAGFAIWGASLTVELTAPVALVAVRGTVLAAPLADYVFKPAMSVGGALAPILGPWIGVGPNRGVGLLISLLGLLNVVVVLVALSSPRIRNLERDLPDHVAAPPLAHLAAGARSPAAPRAAAGPLRARGRSQLKGRSHDRTIRRIL